MREQSPYVTNDRTSDPNWKGMIIGENELVQLIINRIGRYVRVIENTDVPYFLVNNKNLGNFELIGIFLITKYLSWKAGFSKTKGASLDWLQSNVGIKRNVIIARVKNLKDSGYISKNDHGEYEISLASVSKLLDKIESKFTETVSENTS